MTAGRCCVEPTRARIAATGIHCAGSTADGKVFCCRRIAAVRRGEACTAGDIKAANLGVGGASLLLYAWQPGPLACAGWQDADCRRLSLESD